MKMHFVPALFLFFISGLFSSRADVTLPSIFSNHAVLLKSDKVPVWGWASPDETVSVTLDGVKAETKTGADGKWKTVLDLKDKGPGPFELVIEGKNKITVSDVLIGEVWFCSGQSNMERTIDITLNGLEEAAQSANPLLRQFLVKKNATADPMDQCEGEWTLAAPGSTEKFTAVGYYFGKSLNKELKVPVGLVHSSWGGTPCESWTSAQGLDQDPDLKDKKDKTLSLIKSYPEQKRQFVESMPLWLKENNREDKIPADLAAFNGPDIQAEKWTKVTIPAALPAELAKTGVLWLRKEIELPESAAGKGLPLQLEFLSGFDTAYWNGTVVGQSTFESYPGPGAPLRYSIPRDLVKAGKNILAVRLFAPIEAARPSNQINRIRIGTEFQDGEWLGLLESTFPPLEGTAKSSAPKPVLPLPNLQNCATCLYNGMVNPVAGYAIRGTIWYQGEANAGRAWQYRSSFPLMIKDWRGKWGQGDFPFYFCQLAAFMKKDPVPGESNWAELREAQNKTLSLPNTGMANLIDLGEVKDIHPRNKKDVGERLALIALAKDYGKKVTFSGPMFDAIKIESGSIRVSFKYTDGGLVAKPLPPTTLLSSMPELQTEPLVPDSPGSELQGFAVCGEDKVWKWAQAKIDGDTVLVSSTEVPAPVAVRYGWAHNPTCNLYNGAGLPAFPFRSDDFPATTLNAKY